MKTLNGLVPQPYAAVKERNILAVEQGLLVPSFLALKTSRDCSRVRQRAAEAQRVPGINGEELNPLALKRGLEGQLYSRE